MTKKKRRGKLAFQSGKRGLMTLEIALVLVLVLAAMGFGFFWMSRRLQLSLESRLAEVSNAESAQTADYEKRVSQQFELLGRRVFEDSSKKLNDQSLQNLQLLLEPFKERLREFEKKVDDVYASERGERGTLRGELNKLMELNQRMSSETQNLTRALKGDVRTQGAWGELLLENILERSGLRKGEEYLVQDSHRDENGNVVRPDVIVKLPDEKHIIVDSKMSLLSYEEASRAELPADKERWSRDFATSLKRHIDGLAARKYHTIQTLGSPDFVILFIPLEPAFAMAFNLKPEIFTESWDKNIAIVSPTTLLTTLRTVAALWKQDRQEKNALEIADRGGKLYDKFAALVKDVEIVGEQLLKTQKAHEALKNKLSEGNGNLITQVEKLRELGAKTEKKLGLQKPTEL